MRPLICTLAILTAILSCQHRENAIMDAAELMISQKPDSALSLLQSIKPEVIGSSKWKARYALLMSYALDKNYIDVDSDSLIITAVDYYSRHNNARNRMLANYYHGIILLNGHSYSKAIIAFEEAEKDALELSDYHYLGLINRNKSTVFSQTNNIPEAISCIQNTIGYFECAGESNYKAYAQLSLAINYLNGKEYQKADSLLSIIKQGAEDANLIQYCNLRQASILAETNNNTEKALQLFQQVPKSYYVFLDYADYALSLERVGEQDSSDFWMSEGYRHCMSQADSATIDYVKSKIAMLRGQYEEAYYLVKHAAIVQDSLTRKLLYQSVSIAQRDFFKSESKRQNERMESLRKIWAMLSTIFFLILVLIVILAVWRNREKDRILKEQMTRLALNKQAIEDAYRDNAFLLGSLFSSRIAHLDTLTERYYQMEEGKEKDLVFKEIKESVSSLRKDPDIYLPIEKDLNRYCNNVMAKLRSQVPQIKGDNIKIITLFFAGISDEIVYLLLNKMSADSLRMTRSRFRKIIISSNAPDSEMFLNMLNKKKRQQVDTNESR